jgi:uncharacterized RDD family membrane protein YckC
MTVLRPPQAPEVPPPMVHIGLVTRALAFAIDAAIVNAVAITVSAVLALTLSIVKVPDAWTAVLVAAGGALWLVWTVAYFVAFWSATGQTPGNRALRIRVVGADGGVLRPRRALLRFGALLLAALPLLMGFALILVDSRRRGLHDRIAGTLVVEVPEPRRRA